MGKQCVFALCSNSRTQRTGTSSQDGEVNIDFNTDWRVLNPVTELTQDHCFNDNRQVSDFSKNLRSTAVRSSLRRGLHEVVLRNACSITLSPAPMGKTQSGHKEKPMGSDHLHVHTVQSSCPGSSSHAPHRQHPQAVHHIQPVAHLMFSVVPSTVWASAVPW